MAFLLPLVKRLTAINWLIISYPWRRGKMHLRVYRSCSKHRAVGSLEDGSSWEAGEETDAAEPVWEGKEETGDAQSSGPRKILQQISFWQALRRKPGVSTVMGLLGLLQNKRPTPKRQFGRRWVGLQSPVEYGAGIAWFWKGKQANTISL